jgi:hypothetical protein
MMEKMPIPTSLQELASKLRTESTELFGLDDDTVTENIIDNSIRTYDI